MARWYNRRLSGYGNDNPRGGYNARVSGYMSLGYTRSSAQNQARADMIERGEVRRNSRADERNRNANAARQSMTRTQRYNYYVRYGMRPSTATRYILGKLPSTRDGKVEVEWTNPSSYSTTQGVRPTTGGGGGIRGGAGSGG